MRLFGMNLQFTNDGIFKSLEYIGKVADES